MFQRTKEENVEESEAGMVILDDVELGAAVIEERPPAPPAEPSTRGGTRVGRGVVLEGTLKVDGNAYVEGDVKGRIISGGEVVVGSDANVSATLEVRSLTLLGRVEGDVTASAGVEIVASGSLRGDLRTPALKVEPGAHFVGHCDMGDADAG